MAFRDLDGNIISGKKKIIKKKLEKDNYKIGKKFYYIGRTKTTGTRIVYYTGKILEKLDNDMYRVQFIDRYINENNKSFEKIIPKSIINFN